MSALAPKVPPSAPSEGAAQGLAAIERIVERVVARAIAPLIAEVEALRAEREFLTVPDAARLLGMTPAALRQRIVRKDPVVTPAVERMGRSVRLRRSALVSRR